MGEAAPTLPASTATTDKPPRSAWVARKFRNIGSRWPFLRSFSVLSGGTAIGQVLTIAAGPLLTRLYTPAAFGQLAMFTTFVNVMVTVAALRYELSIVSADTEQDATRLTVASLAFAVPSSLLGGVLLYWMSAYGAVGYENLPWYVSLVAVPTVTLATATTVLRYWCLRQQRFGLAAYGSVAQNIGRSVAQLVFGFLQFGVAGLFIAEALGRSCGAGRMVRSAWPDLRAYADAVRWSSLKQTLKQYSDYPKYSLPSSLLNVVASSIALPLIVQLYGASQAGQYSLVWGTLSLSSVLITAAVADTFHSRIAQCARETPSEVVAVFRRTAVSLFLFGLIPTVILRFWGTPLFSFVFGDEWRTAGTISAIIAPWYLAEFVVSPLSRTVLVLRGQRSKLLFDVLSLCSVLAVISAARVYYWPMLKVVELLTVAKIGCYGVFFVILYSIARSWRAAGAVSVEGGAK